MEYKLRQYAAPIESGAGIGIVDALVIYDAPIGSGAGKVLLGTLVTTDIPSKSGTEIDIVGISGAGIGIVHVDEGIEILGI